MIKLIASDVDGTLLHGSHPLDPKYFSLIRDLTARGIHFATASRRQYYNLRRLFAPVADSIDYICTNGSLVVCKGKVCYKHALDHQYGRRLMRALMAIDGCEVLLAGVETCYIQPKNFAYENHMRDFFDSDVTVVSDLLSVPDEFLKISAYFKDGVPLDLVDSLAELAAPLMRPVVSSLPWLDFLLKGCDKGSAMEILQKELGVTKEETMCFGDNENDIEMLQQSGTPCAMRSGNPRLHPYAMHLVDDVADFLQGCSILSSNPT